MLNNYYQTTYRQNEEGAYIISVSLDTYEDVFDDWDASPFKRRDIEDEFLEFLWESSLDIPIKEKIAIEFILPKGVRSEKKEKQMLVALMRHFNYMLSKSKKAFIVEQTESFRYFFIGVIFFLLAYLPLFRMKEIFSQIVSEGLIVGTWVFMWEAFSHLFIECRSLRKDQKTIKRFLASQFVFKDEE